MSSDLSIYDIETISVQRKGFEKGRGKEKGFPFTNFSFHYENISDH